MTSPLTRNDRQGEFPASWYAATVDPPPLRPNLRGEQSADVCIIGAGYTGLTAARVLAAKGLSVIVLEAHRAGFGASGRNGGQVASGYNAPQRLLTKKLGAGVARDLWNLTQEAKTDVADNCAAFSPDAQYKSGIAHGCYSAKERAAHHDDARFLQDTYGYDQIKTYGRDDFADVVASPLYDGGTIDWGGAHIHPLRYALRLAKAAENAGAVIYENSAVHHIDKGAKVTLRTSKGQIKADHLIIATNGYIAGLERKVAATIMPINSFICATAPLNEDQNNILKKDIAVEDSKYFVNYYRMSEDNRLLFGGRASASIAFPDDIGAMLRPRFTALFPTLENVKIDYAWGGTLGVTMTGLPAVQRIDKNTLSAGGFTGHGVALSGLCGKVMAEAIAGQAARFDTLSALPAPAFPGGPALGRPLLQLFLTWNILREKFGL
ncbi:gamma-glutamylputrescine oxidase [Loktanella ponticola]|uniref:Gamma-glutamylputrescine oxidase n=1 Tax=Yoonia ponticola TaxID=1524255 RepID=A0A7W9BLU6_9RHOB|nr:FAD-binding oxidoreductase [Yoonia ponticola]MBB5722701.1 gamma-glutamylputrescine oxidase [Yoonia ponticola]